MNYVDANILIYSLVDMSLKGAKSRQIFEKERVVTSTLSLDEVAYKLLKRSKQDAVHGISTLCNNSSVVFVPFELQDVDFFKELLHIGLYPRDAIHALTAKKMNCPIFYSEDADFDKVVDFVRKTPW